MHAIPKKNNDWSYPSVRLHTTVKTTLARHTYRCNSGTGIIGVTSHFMIGFKAHFIDMKLKPGIGANWYTKAQVYHTTKGRTCYYYSTKYT